MLEIAKTVTQGFLVIDGGARVDGALEVGAVRRVRAYDRTALGADFDPIAWNLDFNRVGTKVIKPNRPILKGPGRIIDGEDAAFRVARVDEQDEVMRAWRGW